MKRVLIFGTGSTGRRIYKELKDKVNVIGFLDNDDQKWGDNIDNVPIIGNGIDVDDKLYDEIIVCSLPGMNAIKEQLLNIGVSSNKINCEYISTQVNARLNFLYDLSGLYSNLPRDISVAEGGVFQGDFAKKINTCFPNRKLFLFDTFEGFDGRDTKKEHENGYSVFEEHHLNISSVDSVLKKMPYPNFVEIRKGYFPETTDGLENERFFFVNLDFDLYNPTLGGLRFFYPRLIEKGILLVHDYYNEGYAGIKAAIDAYEKETEIKLFRFPIGDHCSIAIIKI